MSSAAVYDVVLRLSTTGSLSSGLDQIGGKAHGADEHVSRLGMHGRELTEVFSRAGERVGGMLEGIADKALDIGEHFAKIGIGAAVALATYGVVHLNQELETTQISLGAIAQAQGFASTFDRGFVLAGEQLSKMKQDVKTLPGDLGQLSNIMKMIATPAAAGGANLDQIRQLAGKTMLTAGILGVPQDVAAREMAGLLAGRAGSHNILGGRLGLIGDEAKKFNEESPEKRLATINTEMAKYQGAADRFGQSFVANWTTLKDNIKYVLLAPVTSPLFDHVKQTIQDINGYFDSHKSKIQEIVQTVGNDLAKGWDKAVATAERLLPTVEKIGEAIGKLGPAGVMGAVSHVGAEIIALKAAGMGMQVASSAMPGVGRMAAASSGYLFGGIEAEAAGVTAATGEAAGVLSTLGVISLPALAFAAAGAAGAVDALTDASSKYHPQAVDAAKHLSVDAAIATKHLTEDMQPVRNMFDRLGVGFIQAADVAANMLEGMHEFFQGYNYAKTPHGSLGDTPPDRSNYLPDQEKMFNLLRVGEGGAGSIWANGGGAAPKVPKVQVTNHNTIQINVTSNDPSRLARLVMTEIEKTTPVKSKFAPQYDQSSHY